MAPERQADLAIQCYESRSSDYDSSWHPSFTKRFVSCLNIQAGQHILDLASGTGLLSFLEADAVGSTGRVVGVEVTPGMLAAAKAKKQRDDEKYANVEFHEGDVLILEGVDALKGKSFDMITVASALVLFPDPKAAIKHWATFLKPGGILALDSTHPSNLVAGIVLERTGKRLSIPIPYYREWSKSEDSLKEVLEAAGLEVDEVVRVENQAGYGKRYYELSDADELFEQNTSAGGLASKFADEEIRKKAKAVFKEEWAKLSIDGKVEEVDSVFLGIARKPLDKSNEEVLFSGGCRCGSVKYTSTAPPSDITLCHCRACQQVSGSAFLPFVEVPTSSFILTASSTLRTLKLSNAAERTFCSSCGAPITMVYLFHPVSTSVTRGSIDEESFKCEKPKVRKHIYVKEKAPWLELPDDGIVQEETWSLAHLVERYPQAR